MCSTNSYSEAGEYLCERKWPKSHILTPETPLSCSCAHRVLHYHTWSKWQGWKHFKCQNNAYKNIFPAWRRTLCFSVCVGMFFHVICLLRYSISTSKDRGLKRKQELFVGQGWIHDLGLVWLKISSLVHFRKVESDFVSSTVQKKAMYCLSYMSSNFIIFYYYNLPVV